MFYNKLLSFIDKITGRHIAVKSLKVSEEALRISTENTTILESIRSKFNSVVINKEYPYGLNIDSTAIIGLPRQIDGGNYITIGARTYIGFQSWISAFESYGNQKFTPQIIISEDVTIGNFLCLTCINKIIIEKGCLLSEHVYISDHGHEHDPQNGLLVKQPLYHKGSVVIGENSFIGYRVSILPGVSLGKNCVVGANSVVTKSFPDYSMIGGIPAKLIRRYSFETNSWENID